MSRRRELKPITPHSVRLERVHPVGTKWSFWFRGYRSAYAAKLWTVKAQLDVNGKRIGYSVDDQCFKTLAQVRQHIVDQYPGAYV